ncbi:acetyl/propionyl/methylcrotonyl-CoA carboxylase subunit alpha [Nocardioides pacificus]
MIPIDLHTVLVANRGEIARRVIRTCRRLGIRSVAIFTDLDVHALHVREADEALRVSSYLDIEAVVAAARAAGADAVHPGYGFLSERAEFARALEETGIKLVGPSSTVMDRMGRKDAAREIAVAAGVPVVPRGEDAGFPVLVKAAAGGGGKGMRIVRDASEYDAALAAAKREALSSFGDDTMLVEKYVEHGRHLEVQVLGDAHGSVVHLFERDCSTQRRHQKVIEEAPAPGIDAALRHRLTSAAVALAKHVGYEGAGTVEFLLDADTGEAYFLEMNTRLQVEHPVTEAICGDLDLVEHQLRVAAGEPLSFGQDELSINGHAIEVRVYAEDSFGGFLPQAGTATLVRWPEGVRVDHALESGQVVSTSYDPMLGKIVVHAADRESARRALITALDDTAILGLTTNAGFLRALAASDEFRDAAIDTAWLDTACVEAPGVDTPRVFAAWTQAMLAAEGHLPGGLDAGHPFHADGFRLGAAHASQTVELDRPVVVDRAAGLVGDQAVRELSAERHVVVLSIEGHREQAVVDATAHTVEVVHRGQRHVFTRPDPFLDHAADVGDGTILAPMPGTVLTIDVAEGATVAEGDVLATMEAMKMELTLKAPFAGTVTAVEASVGSQVPLGARLLVVEPETVEPVPADAE